jgi:phage repressor protein C with HTH and peptisase S24 domain
MNDITLRINTIANKYFDGNNVDFGRFMETSEANIRNYRTKNVPKTDFIVKLCEKLEINFDWLLLGKGDIQKTGLEMVEEPKSVYTLKTDRTIKGNQEIPLYNIEASAGIVTLFKDNESFEPVDTIRIPNLPKCDGAVYVTGDSMYPLLKSGDIVIYKQVNDIQNNIFFGEMYLLSISSNGDDYVTVKFIQKSDKGDKYVKLVSQNQYHQPKDILISKIAALALVKASVRINSM